MRHLLLLLITFLSLSAFGQEMQQHLVNFPAAAAAITGGWTYQTLTPSTQFYSGTAQCSATASSCTFSHLPTTAGSALVILEGTGNNVSFSSVVVGSTTATHCSNCAIYNATIGAGGDMSYIAGAPNGSTSTTVNLTSAASGYFVVVIWELLPPKCGGVLCTVSFDGGGTATSTCSTACAGVTPTISATDGVIHYPQSTANLNTAANDCSSGYVQTFFGGCQGLNVTSSTTALTVNVGSSSQTFMDQAISFKSSGGSFTPPAPSPSFALVQAPGNGTGACSSTCTFSIDALGAGDMLWIYAMNSAYKATGSAYISSVSGCGGTWVVPASAQQYSAAAGSISAAYNLSPTTGCTSFTVTVSVSTVTAGPYEVDTIESSRSSGSWTGVDVSSAATNAASTTTPLGVSLSPTHNDICYAGIESATGLPYTQTLYFLPPYGPQGGNNNTPGYGSSGVLYNTTNGAAETWLNSVSEASVVTKTCVY